MFEKHLVAQESNRENGLLNFGDWYDEKKFGGGWVNQEYDTSHCFFVQSCGPVTGVISIAPGRAPTT